MIYGNWTLFQIVNLVRLLGEENALSLLAGEFVCTFHRPSMPTFTIHLNKELSFERARQEGWFGHLDPSITDKHFPVNVPEEGECEVVLYNFPRTKTHSQVLHIFKEEGVQPPTPAHALAFAKEHPVEVSQHDVIVLCKPCGIGPFNEVIAMGKAGANTPGNYMSTVIFDSHTRDLAWYLSVRPKPT